MYRKSAFARLCLAVGADLWDCVQSSEMGRDSIFIPVFMCGVCIQAHMCVQVYMCGCVCVCGDQRSASGVIPQEPPPLFFEVGSLVGPVLTE